MNDATANDKPYQYNGKELESFGGLGWYDYGARYYDPSVGRWTSADPMSETQESWTPYHFNYSSPINFIDYFGLEPEFHQKLEICPTCPNDSKFDSERESKDTYVYEPESGTTYLEGTAVTITASNSESSSLYSYYNQIISTAGKAGDYIDPWVGTSALHVSRQLNMQLEYHSFTTGEGFERSLNKVINPVKTFFGPIKAAKAAKIAKVLGKVGGVLNVISVGSYVNDYRNGQQAKAYTGLAVMAATGVASILCPPCALAAIAVSAGYSLFLEDQIFETVKE